MNLDPPLLYGADIASLTTPVPGGVGPVTVAMLMLNAAHAFEKHIQLKWV